MQEIIDERYGEFFGKNAVPIYKAWFYDFVVFLKRSNLSDEQIKETIKLRITIKPIF